MDPSGSAKRLSSEGRKGRNLIKTTLETERFHVRICSKTKLTWLQAHFGGSHPGHFSSGARMFSFGSVNIHPAHDHDLKCDMTQPCDVCWRNCSFCSAFHLALANTGIGSKELRVRAFFALRVSGHDAELLKHFRHSIDWRWDSIVDLVSIPVENSWTVPLAWVPPAASPKRPRKKKNPKMRGKKATSLEMSVISWSPKLMNKPKEAGNMAFLCFRAVCISLSSWKVSTVWRAHVLTGILQQSWLPSNSPPLLFQHRQNLFCPCCRRLQCRPCCKQNSFLEKAPDATSFFKCVVRRAQCFTHWGSNWYVDSWIEVEMQSSWSAQPIQ